MPNIPSEKNIILGGGEGKQTFFILQHSFHIKASHNYFQNNKITESQTKNPTSIRWWLEGFINSYMQSLTVAEQQKEKV